MILRLAFERRVSLPHEVEGDLNASRGPCGLVSGVREIVDVAIDVAVLLKEFIAAYEEVVVAHVADGADEAERRARVAAAASVAVAAT